MKKSIKTKAQPKVSKRSTGKTDMPELVTVMMKLVERLESLEKKTDLVVSKLTALPSEMRQAAQDSQRPGTTTHVSPPQHSGHGSPQSHIRTLYQAVCADCCKRCEVPFKPTAERPVYCKECFVKRKAGHVPQNPDMRSQGPIQPRPVSTIPREVEAPVANEIVSKGKKSKKQKPVKAKKKK